MTAALQTVERVACKGSMPDACEILERLNALAPLPLCGILAGGAVANTILAIIDGKEYPVNDLDIFLTKKQACIVEVEGVAGTCDGTKTIVAADGILVSRNGHYPTELVTVKKCYEIRHSLVAGLLNYIVIGGPDSGLYRSSSTFDDSCEECEDVVPEKDADRQPSLLEILRSFDLNACQAGIDLASGELVMTPDFASFVKSRQLRVCNVSTPLRSVARLIEKKRALNCYCDVNGEFAMLATAQTFFQNSCGDHEYNEDAYIGQEVYDRIDRVKDELPAPLDIKYQIGDDEADRSYYIEFPLQCVNQEVLKALQETYLEFEARAASEGFRRIWDVLARPQTPKSHRKAFLAGSEYQEIVTGVCLFDNFLGTNVSPVKLRRVGNFLNDHCGLRMRQFGRTLDEAYQSVRVIDALKDKGMILIGAMENDAIALDVPIERQAAIAAVDAYLVELGEAPLTAPFPIPRLISWLVNAKELVTAAELMTEGVRMHHCVGGYAAAVESGASRIFHLTVKGKPSTVEFNPSNHGLYHLCQHKGPRNAEVSARQALAASLLQLSFLWKRWKEEPRLIAKMTANQLRKSFRCKLKRLWWETVDWSMRKVVRRRGPFFEKLEGMFPWLPVNSVTRIIDRFAAKIDTALDLKKYGWEEIPF